MQRSSYRFGWASHVTYVSIQYSDIPKINTSRSSHIFIMISGIASYQIYGVSKPPTTRDLLIYVFHFIDKHAHPHTAYR